MNSVTAAARLFALTLTALCTVYKGVEISLDERQCIQSFVPILLQLHFVLLIPHESVTNQLCPMVLQLGKMSLKHVTKR